MIRKPKMGQDVLVIDYADRGINILKGKVVGCYEEGGRLKFLVDTVFGRRVRFDEDMFTSTSEIAQNIDNYVVE